MRERSGHYGFLPLSLLHGFFLGRAWRRYMQLPAVEAGKDVKPSATGTVSVVVPARNEALRIPSLLRSLLLDPLNVSVLVLDDDSSDGTGEIARSAGASVRRTSGPPAGWTGKNWSCWQGALAVEGEWICFVDADVVITPETLERAVQDAEHREADLLSLFLQQTCVTFWEKLLLPYAFSLYFAGGGGERTNTTPSRALANGQFMLVKREAYFAVGGHEAIRGSVIDDVALAALFIRHGRRVVACRAEELGRVRMYDGFGSLWRGFAKNAVQFSMAGRDGWATVASSLLGSWLATRALRDRSRGQAVGLVITSLIISPWYRRFGVSRRYALLSPVAAIVLQMIAIEGIIRRLTGHVEWSGRRLP